MADQELGMRSIATPARAASVAAVAAPARSRHARSGSPGARPTARDIARHRYALPVVSPVARRSACGADDGSW